MEIQLSRTLHLIMVVSTGYTAELISTLSTITAITVMGRANKSQNLF